MCGIMGLAINHVSFLVIQYSNAVTIKVLGMVRNALLVLFTVFVQGEQVTGLQFFGYAITLFGFGLYNYFKVSRICVCLCARVCCMQSPALLRAPNSPTHQQASTQHQHQRQRLSSARIKRRLPCR